MPQLENGYLKLANELVEAYTRSRIPGEAMQCLWVIIRRTYGFGKLEDSISISQFSEHTGLKRQHAHRGIAKLIELNLVTKKGDKYIASYRINKDFKTWSLSPKKVTVPKMVTSRPKNGYKGVPKMVNTKESIKDIIKDIVEYLNLKTGKSFKNSTKHTVDKIQARMNDGFTVNDFKKVIDVKSSNWKDDKKMSPFLRPETLFGNKFESYLNEDLIPEEPKAPELEYI